MSAWPIQYKPPWPESDPPALCPRQIEARTAQLSVTSTEVLILRHASPACHSLAGLCSNRIAQLRGADFQQNMEN
ncbi:hypothetical protein SUGI_0954550 [Cryptomeria japonica]|nr:hypothetical protein SUGI_0954550 [Cryptomeria japonica]